MKKVYKYNVKGEQGDDLRKRFEKVMEQFPYSMTEAARDMGISYMTLSNFLEGSSHTFRKSMWAIRTWIEEKERM